MRKTVILTILVLLIVQPLFALAQGVNYRFTGQELDAESGLYNFNAREYNPNIGRFNQPDPVLNNLADPQKLQASTGQDLQKFLENPQALNSYSYTINNPVKYIDPTGEWFKEFFTGRQSWPSFQGELGEASMYVNPVMSKAIDHPYITGAVTGAIAGLGLALTGIIAGTTPWQLATASSIALPITAQVVQKVSNLSKLDALEQTPSATNKLNSISQVIGKSTEQILKLASKSNEVLTDLRHGGNVNVFIQNPMNEAKLIRITLDPTLTRIMSAGFNRIGQVQQWISSGNLIEFIK